MITDIIINTFYFFAQFIVSFLATTMGVVNTNGNIATGIDTMVGYYSALSVILPISTLIAIVAVDLVIETAIFTYKVIRWGYRKIPFIS